MTQAELDYTHLSAAREAAPTGTGSIVIAANENIGSGPRLPIDELHFERYLNNPVVLWRHDQQRLPVARTTDLRREEGKIIADFKFFEGDEFATKVQRAWEQGIVNAASVRWDTDTNEMIEWSFVGIPSDPDAVRLTAERALDALLKESIVTTEQPMRESAPAPAPAPAAPPAPPPIDIDALRREMAETISSSVAAGIAELRKEMGSAPAPVETPTETDTNEAVREMAADRTKLILRAMPFLPEDFDTALATERDILEAALGDGLVEGESIDYLRGKLDSLTAPREAAAAARSAFMGRTSQPTRDTPSSYWAQREADIQEWTSYLENAWQDGNKLRGE